MKNDEEISADKGERLAKTIARAGVCSRREAEKLIEEGVVKVDGVSVRTPAFNVTPDQKISVRGKLLAQPEAARLWLYNKPRGLITSHKDPEGRPTVFDALPKGMPRVISVGRLDLYTEGLLLLTNSGELARFMELPSTGWKRRYKVRYHGPLTEADMERIRKGITVEGVQYGAAEVRPEKSEASNKWLSITIAEGKNREVRRILEHFGCKVSRLIRLSYGPFALGALPRGEAKEMPRAKLKPLLPKGMV
jgi:23S rRNA pseudouridine2605 synthase